MQNNSVRGFIFLAVLIFLYLFSALGLYALMHVTTTLKMTSHRWQRTNDLSAADAILRHLENNLLTAMPACQIPVTSAATLAKQPLAWWQQHACRDYENETWYYYAVERLGKDPCAQTDYTRLTLYIAAEKLKQSRIVMQSTIAKTSNDTSTCQTKIHVVKPGRQMHREI